MGIVQLLLLGFVSFLPIMLWAYSFAYISDNPLNKKRFFAGIAAGIFSIVPIFYMQKIVSFVSGVAFFETFSPLRFWGMLLTFVLLLGVFSFLIGKLFFKTSLKGYWKQVLVFFIFSIVLGVFYLSLGVFPDRELTLTHPPVFSGVFFSTLQLIVLYYLMVAIVEEASKHFHFLQSSIFAITNLKTSVENAIFVALGFSFVENILYLYQFSQIGSSEGLLQLYFFRSVFAVIVHVTCSSVIAYYFSKYYFGKMHSIFIVFYGIFVSILLHLIYDISLSFDLGFVLFLYFIGGYLYVSSIFYRD